ncbi:MAG: glycosyltransferase family 4 protein [Bacteroidota bacterium]|nr:glycosyltransferase family 4 protein [Bacteroidota bacterium]
MIWWKLILILLVAFSSSLLITRFLVQFLTKKGMMDIPNDRSSHKIPTPRGGGMAIIISVVIAVLLLMIFYPEAPIPGWLFFLGAFIVTLTSFIDDKINLTASLRFLLHAFAAGLIIYETGGFQAFPLPEPLSFELGWLGYPITFVWIVAVLNIYNFLDGIDGYAGSQAVIAGIAIAFLDIFGTGFYMGSIIAAAAVGFLVYNWHPAKIFMGDIGSATLGFVFASLPLYFTSTSISIGIYALIIFLWFFLSDGAFTIIRRALAGEKIWEAHRSHLYQQLVISGASHSKVVSMVMLSALVLSVIFIILYHYYYSLLYVTFVFAILFFIMYYMYVMHMKKKPGNN